MLPAVSLTLADPPEDGRIHVVLADTAAQANTIGLMLELSSCDDRS
jgi:hypothetical protein